MDKRNPVLELQNKEMWGFIGEPVDKLRNAGVYTLLLKGQGIAQCYDYSLLKPCGDVNLFLSDDNYEKTKFLVGLMQIELY